jgi:adenylate cyclase
MSGDRVERRLAAILAADVAGYSRLMGADEEGTHWRLQAHLRELVNPKIGEHRGRIVKNTGDGFFKRRVRAIGAGNHRQARPCSRNGAGRIVRLPAAQPTRD